MKNTMRTYGRWFAIVAIVATLLPQTVLAYSAAPVAVTDGPTYITEKSAQLNGRVNPNEMPDTNYWFEWGIVGREGIVYETQHSGMWYASNVLGNTTATIVGLAPNTQYFYRQVAENSRGKDQGMTTYFTTKPLSKTNTPLIIVETKHADSITETTAVVHGYVSPHGGNGAKWWFEWGATSKLEFRTSQQGAGGNSAPVTMTLSGLTPGTAYYYRMVGENELGQVVGVTQVFVTRGVAPVVTQEAPRTQTVQSPSRATDEVTRTETANATVATQNVGNPWFSVQGPNIFEAIFGKKKTAATTSSATAEQTPSNTQANAGTGSNTTSGSNTDNAVPANTQVASASAATPVGTFWNTLSGKKGVEVNIEKVGPEKVPAHTAIEYRVTYAYRLSEAVSDARLKIILPENVVYIGDNTTNELLLEEGTGPERTYVLPIGKMENGTTRTISILGMTTGAANGTFPDARARVEYRSKAGVVAVGAGEAVASETSVADLADSISLLPTSVFGWTLYLALLVATIIAVRKAKAYYARRKAEIAAEEEEQARLAALTQGKTA